MALVDFSGGDDHFRQLGWEMPYALIPWSLLARNRSIEAVPVDALPPLPFDHQRIVAKAVERLRGKATCSSLLAFPLPAEFTMNLLTPTADPTGSFPCR